MKKPTILLAALAAVSLASANSPNRTSGKIHPKDISLIAALTANDTIEEDGCSVTITLRLHPLEPMDRAFARAVAAGLKWLRANPGRADGQIAAIGWNDSKGYRVVTWSTYANGPRRPP